MDQVEGSLQGVRFGVRKGIMDQVAVRGASSNEISCFCGFGQGNTFAVETFHERQLSCKLKHSSMFLQWNCFEAQNLILFFHWRIFLL